MTVANLPADRIIKIACSWIGTPYRHQACLKGAGCDCLGLIRGVYRELYNRKPEQSPVYTADWAEETGAETMRDAARRHLHEIDITKAGPGDENSLHDYFVSIHCLLYIHRATICSNLQVFISEPPRV